MKAQVSFEFIMIFTLIIMSIMGFTFVVNQRLFEIAKQRDRVVMKNLADNIQNEITLASSVSNNYFRKFDIPINLLGRRYNISLEDNDLVVEMDDEIYFTSLPVEVKGSFIEDVDENTTEHCISKNSFDGIRISKNQASLDANMSEVHRGEEFDVFFSLNCVVNAISVRVVIAYDADKLEVVDAEPVTRSIVKYRLMNPMFESYSLIYDYSSSGSKYLQDTGYGRFTYGYLADKEGKNSGNVAKIRFKVKDDAELGQTSIEFDKLFEEEYLEESIRILDSSTGEYTKAGLPDSNKAAQLRIV